MPKTFLTFNKKTLRKVFASHFVVCDMYTVAVSRLLVVVRRVLVEGRKNGAAVKVVMPI